MFQPAENSKKLHPSNPPATPTLASIDKAIGITLNKLRDLESTYGTPSLSKKLEKGQYSSALDIAKYSISEDEQATTSLLGALYTYVQRIQERRDILTKQSTRKDWIVSKAVKQVFALLKRKDQPSQVIEQIEKYINRELLNIITVLGALERELEANHKNPSALPFNAILETHLDPSIEENKAEKILNDGKSTIQRVIILKYLQLHELLRIHFPDFKGGSLSDDRGTFRLCEKYFQNIATWRSTLSVNVPSISAIEQTNKILQNILAQPSETTGAPYNYTPRFTSTENFNRAATQAKRESHFRKLAAPLALSPDQQKRIIEMLTYWQTHS